MQENTVRLPNIMDPTDISYDVARIMGGVYGDGFISYKKTTPGAWSGFLLSAFVCCVSPVCAIGSRIYLLVTVLVVDACPRNRSLSVVT